MPTFEEMSDQELNDFVKTTRKTANTFRDNGDDVNADRCDREADDALRYFADRNRGRRP